MILILAVLGVALTVLIRCIPRIIRPNAVDSDTWFHLLAAERIRNKKFRIPAFLEGFIISSPYNYPPLFHYLLALFSRHTRERLERYISAIIDGLHVVAVFCFTEWLFNYKFASSLTTSTRWVGLLAMLVFATYPALVSVATGPRAFQATPRILGEFLFTVSIFLFNLFIETEQLLPFLGAIVFAGFLLLTSKFGTQVLLFTLVFLAFFMSNLLIIGWLFGSLTFAIIISKGHYLKVIKGHIGHSVYYCKHVKSRFISERNKVSDILHLPIYLVTTPKEAFRILYYKNSFTTMILKNPALLLTIFLLYKNYQPSVTEFRFIIGLIVGGGIAFILTSLRPLLFLGEAERYVEYTAGAISALLPIMIVIHNNYFVWLAFFAIILYHTASLLGNYKIFSVRLKNDDNIKSFNKASRWLENNPVQGIISIPISLSYSLLYNTSIDVLFWGANLSENALAGDEYQNLFVSYPFVNSDLDYVYYQYKVDTVVCYKKGLSDAKEIGIEYNFASWDLKFEDTEYLVYQYSV